MTTSRSLRGLDCFVEGNENELMNTNETNLYTPEIRAMLEEAIHHVLTGKGDPEVLRQIHEEAEKIRAEIYREHGLLDIGVPAIRELRDGDEA
jgi:hypothetical protein